jgi:hypothetical protein
MIYMEGDRTNRDKLSFIQILVRGFLIVLTLATLLGFILKVVF